MRAFVVLGFVFPYQAKRLAWGTSPKLPILCRVGRKTLTQSIKSCVILAFIVNNTFTVKMHTVLITHSIARHFLPTTLVV